MQTLEVSVVQIPETWMTHVLMKKNHLKIRAKTLPKKVFNKMNYYFYPLTLERAPSHSWQEF